MGFLCDLCCCYCCYGLVVLFLTLSLVLASLPSMHASPCNSDVCDSPTDKKPSHQFDVSGCGIEKGCLMKPPGCTPHKDCAYAMSYVADHSRVHFELLGQVNASCNSYVALGFSMDGNMGGDTVTDCSCFQNGKFSARLSYNPGKSNRKVPLDADMESHILETHSAHFADGTVLCRFSQRILLPPSVQSQFVRALNTPIYCLMSSGTTSTSRTQNNELNIHTLNMESPRFPFSSPTPVSLTQYRLAPGMAFPRGWTDEEASSVPENSTEPATTNTVSSMFNTSTGSSSSTPAEDLTTSSASSELPTAGSDCSDSADGLIKAHGEQSQD